MIIPIILSIASAAAASSVYRRGSAPDLQLQLSDVAELISTCSNQKAIHSCLLPVVKALNQCPSNSNTQACNCDNYVKALDCAKSDCSNDKTVAETMAGFINSKCPTSYAGVLADSSSYYQEIGGKEESGNREEELEDHLADFDDDEIISNSTTIVSLPEKSKVMVYTPILSTSAPVINSQRSLKVDQWPIFIVVILTSLVLI